MATQFEETTDVWGEVTSRVVATSSAAIRPWTCSETPSEMTWEDLPEPPKPTRAHRAAIAELGLRFQPANTADLDAYSLRLELLAKDCAHLAVPLLRAACDRAAKDARGLPYAVTVLEHATSIVAERQQFARDSVRVASGLPPKGDGFRSREDELRDLSREYNRDNAAKGSPLRWSETMATFRIGDPGEKRSTNDNGEVIS